MLLHDSKFVKERSLVDVKTALDALELNDDYYKAQFKLLIETLVNSENTK